MQPPKMKKMPAFAKMVEALSKRPNVKDPKALAAFIGRQKYGAAGMAAKAAAARKGK